MTKELWRIAAEAADAKKADGIVVLDTQEISSVTDYMIVCEGNSVRHVRTIADAVEEAVAREGRKIYGREGKREDRWVLLDLGTVVVHVLTPRDRVFYNLERLWSQAVPVPFEPHVAAEAS